MQRSSRLNTLLSLVLLLCVLCSFTVQALVPCPCLLSGCVDNCCNERCSSCSTESVSSCTCDTACGELCAKDASQISSASCSTTSELVDIYRTCVHTRSSQKCLSCVRGYFDPSTACQSECPGGASNPCNGRGVCDATYGYCTCNPGYAGASCDQCAPNYYPVPNSKGECRYCLSSVICSGKGVCSSEGTCDCDKAYAGANCDRCAVGYFGFPDCRRQDPYVFFFVLFLLIYFL